MVFKRFLFVLSLMVCMIPTAVMADGFAVLEWSAGGVAMGEAYMFADDDASLLAYNPAGITRLKGKMVSGGITYINPRGRSDFFSPQGIRDGETWSNTEAPGYVPNLYYTSQVNDRLTWGVGFYSRFGNSSEFDPSFPGRFNSYKAKILSVSAVPTLAWKVTPKLSLAVGAEIMYMSLDARKKMAMPAPLSEVDFRLDGAGFGYGWNISLNYDFDARNSLAAVYRSRINMKLDGDIYVAIPGQTTTGGGDVTLPDSLTFGFGHKFNGRTRAEIGATHTWWSTYDRLTINFNSSIGGLSEQSTRKDWKNVWRYQAGVEHKMDDCWTVMFGYAYDNAPMPDDTVDFMVPTGDRQTISAGLRYHNRNEIWTFAYAYMWIKDRVIPGLQDGQTTSLGYANSRDSDAHIISLSYTLKLK